MDILSARLRELRSEKKFDQGEVSEAVSVSRSSYSAYENGAVPAVSTIMALAKFFDVSIDYLLGVSNSRQSKATSLDDLVSQLFKVAGRNILSSDDFHNLVQVLTTYYRTGAIGGDIPAESIRNFLSSMHDLIRASVDRDIPAAIDAANRSAYAGIQASEIIKELV